MAQTSLWTTCREEETLAGDQELWLLALVFICSSEER